MSKVAVYTIAKNEEQFVERWVKSASDADYLLILDTGSTDKTVDLARSLGVDVWTQVFDPWRFDTARNAALNLLRDDADMCIALDMDEVLVDGWREHVERAIADGVTRPRYKYVWSWNGNREGLVYGGDKIHARHGYYWRHPVHEVLSTDGEERQRWYGLQIHHHPDASKSRGQYLPLLELAVNEDPSDDRNSHYLAREYFFAGRLEEAKAEFVRHLGLPKALWPAERAQSMRYLYKITGRVGWLEDAVRTCPDRREAWVDLAKHHYDQQEWDGCLLAVARALRIKEKPLEYLTEEFAWGALPYDLGAIAAYNLGLFEQAKYWGMQALKLAPYDARLVGNYRLYREAAA